MHKKNLIKENKLIFLKQNICLFTIMGIFSNLKTKKIKNNKKKFFRNISLQKKRQIEPEGNNVNLHLDTVEKVDEIITKNGPEDNTGNQKTSICSKNEPMSSNGIENREPIVRSQETSLFNSEINTKDSVGELNKIEEFRKILTKSS